MLTIPLKGDAAEETLETMARDTIREVSKCNNRDKT
jgi:hypothetical protein